ncbi:hypothetical protein BGZ82_001760 [Podila clonocystis]|nr:hypothetical protein BGZ82_001760 [Podila clonocystis]
MFFSILSIATLLAVAGAQPQTVTPRTSRAIAVIDSDIYLYGGNDGWTAGNAPWNNIKLDLDKALALSQTSYAAPSADGNNLFFYGQTLCPSQLAKDSSAPHSFVASSGSVTIQREKGQWTQTGTAADVLGPRLVQADEPVPVQVVDPVNHVVYTFVYDANNPQLGMQLWTFSADHPSANIAHSSTPTPTNSTNTTEPVPPPPTPVIPPPITLAPFIDVGAAVYLDGTIVVVGGGRTTGLQITGDDVDAASGYYKMDRCWVYNIAANTWSVQNLFSPPHLPRPCTGFEHQNSKAKASRTGFVMIYDPASSTWGNQFGTIRESFFQKHTVAIICGSLGGLLALLICASVSVRLWRKHSRGHLSRSTAVNWKRSKPFVASTAIKPDSVEAAAEATSAAAAGRLSGVTLASTRQRDNYGRLDSQIDLSALPRASESTMYGVPHQQQFQNQHSLQHQDSYQYQYNFNPYAPVNQQQQVPLMQANAMEQPEDLQAYTDDDRLFERDGQYPSRPSSGQGVGYPGQTQAGSGANLTRGAPIKSTVSPRDLDGFP